LLGPGQPDQIGEGHSEEAVSLFGAKDSSLELDENQKRLLAR
jgi:hypothetical protein